MGDRSSTVTLFRAVFRKDLILLARYPVNTAARLVTLYFLFAVIFFGGEMAAGPALSETLSGLIVGFFLFTVTTSAYWGLAGNVMREAQWGTLEQLYMSPHGFGTVMATKVVSNVVMSLLWGSAMLALMLVTTGESLSVDVLTVVPIALLTVGSVVGLGFAFAGLALVYKRIDSISGLVQFALVGLISAPAFDIWWTKFLPIALGSGMLQAAMRNGVRLWEFPAADLALLVATAVGYTVVGYASFQVAQRRARRMGVMGQY